MATDVIVLDAVESMAEDIDTTLDEKLDPFIDEATAIVEKLGTGLPPRDMISFTSQSTDEGIKLTFTPPKPTYFAEHTNGDGKQFACMPAGVVIRYSDKEYPRTPNDGVFGYEYKPNGDWDTESHECTIVGLTKDTKYYFTAFPYSTEHVYNKNQVTSNRTEMTWVGNKGTISVDVKTPDGYQGTLGEYTITLVEQASSGGQNIEQTANGSGVTRFGNLEGGKTYKVRLSTTGDLQAPADSEPITIVGGINYDVTMTYASRYGTITVNVSTQPAGMPIGAYTVTLTPQGGGESKTAQGNNTQSVTFNNVENGTVYDVSLSAINHYTANAGGTVKAVGGQSVQHNANYTFSATLQQCTWEEIKQISASGKAPSCFNVGDTKSFICRSETLYAEIIEFRNGITFDLKDVMSNYKIGTSRVYSGGFWESDTYSNLVTDIYPQIESSLRSVIKTVSKNSTVIEKGLYTFSNDENCNIFLFSVKEVFGKTTINDVQGEHVWPSEGSQYALFATQEKRKKSNTWILRSASNISQSASYWYTDALCNQLGDLSYSGQNTSWGLNFGFCV